MGLGSADNPKIARIQTNLTVFADHPGGNSMNSADAGRLGVTAGAREGWCPAMSGFLGIPPDTVIAVGRLRWHLSQIRGRRRDP